MINDYNITLGNDIATDVHSENTMGNNVAMAPCHSHGVAKVIHCDVIMSKIHCYVHISWYHNA